VLRIGSVVLGVTDLHRAIMFWCAALGYVHRDDDVAADADFVVLVPPGGSSPGVSLQVSVTPLQEHPRVHLDLYADRPAEEVDRLVALGAERVAWDLYPDDPDFVVLADTEGNRFCVIDKSDDPTHIDPTSVASMPRTSPSSSTSVTAST
jgi:catechol 2,3-dioxygenase-like lactoylglutathione lyase family enzyme